MDLLRVLIADDHPMFRQGLRTIFEAQPSIDVVGEARTGEEAIVLSEQLQPDLVLMDIRMPGINGIEATRRILEASPHIRVLILTMFQDEASVFTAMRAGARGYVLKDADKEDILRALFAVGRGEAIFSPDIATRIVDFFSATPRLHHAKHFRRSRNANARFCTCWPEGNQMQRLLRVCQ